MPKKIDDSGMSTKGTARRSGLLSAAQTAYKGTGNNPESKNLRKQYTEALNRWGNHHVNDARTNGPMIKEWNKSYRQAEAQGSLKQTNASDRFGARKAAIAKKVK